MKIYKVRFFGSKYYKQYILPELIKFSNIKIVENDNFDIGIVADYGHIFKPNELNCAKFGFFNFHPSDLPAYRGPTPLQTMILDGIKQSCVTLIKMNEKIDAGEIISKYIYNLLPSDTTKTLKEKTALIASKMLNDIFLFLNGKIMAKKQNIDKILDTQKLEKKECKINFNDSIIIADRKIRACFSNPKAYILYNKTRLIIHTAKIIDNCLKIEVIQKEGKRPLTFDEYKKGEKDKILLDKLSKFC